MRSFWLVHRLCLFSRHSFNNHIFCPNCSVVTRKLHRCFRIQLPSMHTEPVIVGESGGRGADYARAQLAKEEVMRRFGDHNTQSDGSKTHRELWQNPPCTTVFIPLSIAPSVIDAAFAVIAARRVRSAGKDREREQEFACKEFSLAMLRRDCDTCMTSGYTSLTGHTCGTQIEQFLSENLRLVCLVFDIPLNREFSDQLHNFLVYSTDLSMFTLTKSDNGQSETSSVVKRGDNIWGTP